MTFQSVQSVHYNVESKRLRRGKMHFSHGAQKCLRHILPSASFQSKLEGTAFRLTKNSICIQIEYT